MHTPSKYLICILVFLTALSRAHSELRLHDLSPGTHSSTAITDGQVICPDDFPYGFSIECVGEQSDSRAVINVNGETVRRENRRPFFIAGDTHKGINEWVDYTRTSVIECLFASGPISAAVSFTCDTTQGSSPTSDVPVIKPAAPASMFVCGADRSSAHMVELKDDISICPDHEFGTDKITILCTASEKSRRATFRINRKEVSKAFKKPYHIEGEVNGVARPWEAPGRRFTIVCSLNDGYQRKARRVLIGCPKEATPPDPISPVEKDPSECTLLQAKDTELSEGWVEDHEDGVTFRPNNRSKTVEKAGVAPLYYKFIAKANTQYGVSIDMTTRGRADFNDIFMRFRPGGFRLIRDSEEVTMTRWIKGYHNFMARAVKVVSVDEHAHSVSTELVLQKGEEYEFAISGRSNRVTVHQILLIPCQGGGCQRKQWKDMQELCLPGSTNFSKFYKANRVV